MGIDIGNVGGIKLIVGMVGVIGIFCGQKIKSS